MMVIAHSSKARGRLNVTDGKYRRYHCVWSGDLACWSYGQGVSDAGDGDDPARLDRDVGAVAAVKSSGESVQVGLPRAGLRADPSAPLTVGVLVQFRRFQRPGVDGWDVPRRDVRILFR
jgi:hypothetical protein